MKEDEIEEVELDLQGEDAPSAGPPAEMPEEPDDATRAFTRLEGEMAMMRRAVQHLAAERADIVIPDYSATLGQMAGQLDTVSKSLTSIGERPAIKLTPEVIADQIKRASVDMQRENRELFTQTRQGLDSALVRWSGRSTLKRSRSATTGAMPGQVCSQVSFCGRSFPAPLPVPCPIAGIGRSGWPERFSERHLCGMQASG